jgi:hypothetical protein
MKSPKTLVAGAVAAVAALVLSACAPSWVTYGTVIEASASGTVNLLDYNGTFLGGTPFTPGDGTRTPGGDNTTAKSNIKLSYDQGNWNINGSWSDGVVRFKVKGLAMNVVGLNFLASPDAVVAAAGATVAEHREHRGSSWLYGGCMPFATHYESTNPDRPGTGVAVIVICDAGLGEALNIYGPNSGELSWEGPDYIAIAIPNLQDAGPYSDLSPFANYSSGGTLTGRKNVAVVRAKANYSTPSNPQEPLWTPSPSNSPTPTPTPTDTPPPAPQV